MDTANFRRSAFTQAFNKKTPVKTVYIKPDQGVDQLNEIAIQDIRVNNAINLFNWNCHKVFAINSVSQEQLKKIVNAGALTYRGKSWHSKTVGGNRKIIQIPTTPFRSSWLPKNDHCSPSYWNWLYGKTMYPKAINLAYDESYQLGDTAFSTPNSYKVFQYMTMLFDIGVNDIFQEDQDSRPMPELVKTFFQVYHSLRNVLFETSNSESQDPKLKQLTIQKCAEELATLLLIRDGDMESACHFNKMVNTLDPLVFLSAMKLIACDKVTVMDSSGAQALDNQGAPLPSSSLFHHSVFPDADLVFMSLMFENDHEEIEHFMPYMVCHNMSKMLQHEPAVSLKDYLDFDDAVQILLINVGGRIKQNLQKLYFMKLLILEVLGKQTMTLSSTQTIVENLILLVKGITDITSLILALIPATAEIPGIDKSLAEIFLKASLTPSKEKKRFTIDVKILQKNCPTTLLTENIRNNISQNSWLFSMLHSAKPASCTINVDGAKPADGFPNRDFTDKPDRNTAGRLMDIPRSASVQSRPILAILIDEFKDNPELLNHPRNRLRLNQSKETPIISACNQLLIEFLYAKIATLVLGKQWNQLKQLCTEIEEMQTLIQQSKDLDEHKKAEILSKAQYPKELLVGIKKTRTLIRHLMERQFSASKIDYPTLCDIFQELGIKRNQKFINLQDKLAHDNHNDRSHVDILEPNPDFRETLLYSVPSPLIQPIRGTSMCINRFTDEVITWEKKSPKHSSAFISRVIDFACTSPEQLKMMQEKSLGFSAKENSDSRSPFISLTSLPDCIARQTQRKECCCICYEEQSKKRPLFNPHNSHKNMQICSRCITLLLKSSNSVCPFCRVPINEQSFTGYDKR